MKKAFRILVTFVTLAAGGGIALALTYAGKSNQGPINDVLDEGGAIVRGIERNIIEEPKEEKRSAKLPGLDGYRADVSLLKNPRHFLLGAFDNKAEESYESVMALEDSLHTVFPLIQIYAAWGSKEDQQFPSRKMQAIEALGSVPVLTWEPWLSAFDEAHRPELRKKDDRDKGGLADIAAGMYDFYINGWAKKAARFKSPFFLRFGHEMNDPYRYPWGPQNNTAADYISAYKHVHEIFMKHGATNVIWVYAPHAAYGSFRDYYPGDSTVDYVGTGVLNYGNVASWSQWWSFDEIFGKHYTALAAFRKPIMITEFASLATGGKRSDWYRDAFSAMAKKYPLVRSLIFFHFSDDKTTTQQALNWYVNNDTSSVAQIRKGLAALK